MWGVDGIRLNLLCWFTESAPTNRPHGRALARLAYARGVPSGHMGGRAAKQGTGSALEEVFSAKGVS